MAPSSPPELLENDDDLARSLAPWRAQIDALDEQILHLLQKRVQCALEVGHIKKERGTPIHDPSREKRIYEKLCEKQESLGGTLPPSAITAIFREIISACRAAEHPTTVAFLGPEGTNTQEATLRFFGSAVEGLPCVNPDEVCRAVVGGNTTFGVLAIENSIHGLVSPTLDLLASSPLVVTAEIELPIHHCLLSNSKLEGVTKVYSHEQALAQCRGWLGAHLPHAMLVPVPSTARGAQMAGEETGAAAIGSDLAANLYGLQIAARGIEDIAGNKTRFFVVANPDKAPAPSSNGRDKTSLTFLTPHRPGALVEALSVLSKHGVNVMMIQSRPSRQAAWEYRFFADVSGHRDASPLQNALQELRDHTFSVQVIGSYPEAS